MLSANSPPARERANAVFLCHALPTGMRERSALLQCVLHQVGSAIRRFAMRSRGGAIHRLAGNSWQHDVFVVGVVVNKERELGFASRRRIEFGDALRYG